MDLQARLTILADAAKYDASCASSGSKRERPDGGIGNGAGRHLPLLHAGRALRLAAQDSVDQLLHL